MVVEVPSRPRSLGEPSLYGLATTALPRIPTRAASWVGIGRVRSAAEAGPAGPRCRVTSAPPPPLPPSLVQSAAAGLTAKAVVAPSWLTARLPVSAPPCPAVEIVVQPDDAAISLAHQQERAAVRRRARTTSSKGKRGPGAVAGHVVADRRSRRPAGGAPRSDVRQPDVAGRLRGRGRVGRPDRCASGDRARRRRRTAPRPPRRRPAVAITPAVRSRSGGRRMRRASDRTSPIGVEGTSYAGRPGHAARRRGGPRGRSWHAPREGGCAARRAHGSPGTSRCRGEMPRTSAISASVRAPRSSGARSRRAGAGGRDATKLPDRFAAAVVLDRRPTRALAGRR